MACSTAWWSCSRLMSLFSFCFDLITDQEWVDRTKIWQNTSCPYPIFTACSEVKVHANFFDCSTFHSFIFTRRTHVWNMQKFAPYEEIMKRYIEKIRGQLYSSASHTQLLQLLISSVDKPCPSSYLRSKSTISSLYKFQPTALIDYSHWMSLLINLSKMTWRRAFIHDLQMKCR